MPHPLSQRIDDVTQRARRAAVLRAVGLVVAVTLGVALLLMAADYLMRLSDPGMRWLFSLLMLAALGAAAYRWLGKREWRGITPLAIAQRIQSTRPALGSRLASAVEFLEQPVEDPSAGSADLRRSVVVQAAAEVDQLDLNEVVDRRPVRRAMQFVAIAFAAFFLFGVLDPPGLRTAAARLATPWSDNAWPRRNHLSFEEAPHRVARGQAFEAMLADSSGAALPPDLRVQYRMKSGGRARVEEQFLPAGAPQVAVLRENVQQSFAYRAVGGDDDTMPWREVAVVDPPQVTSYAVTATPPEYTGLPPTDLRADDRVYAGTHVNLTLDVAAKVKSATLQVTTAENSEQLPCSITAGSSVGSTRVTLSKAWVTSLAVDRAEVITYRVRLVDQDGLVSHAKRQTLRVEPDPVPAVEWIQPETEMVVTAQAVVPIRALVEDNLAVAQVELLWQQDSEVTTQPANDQPQDATKPVRESAPERIALSTGPESPPKRATPPWSVPADSREQAYEFDLSHLDLKPGDQLVLLVQASDYRPGIGQTSLPRRVTILSEEEFDARLAQLQSDLASDLKRLLAEQRRTREGAGELQIERQNGAHSDRATADRLSALGFEQLRVNEGVTDPARGAVRQAQRLIGELQSNRQDRPELSEQLKTVRDALKQLAQGSLASAGRSLADAQRSAQQAVEEPSAEVEKEVNQSLAKATGKQDRAIESLEGLVEQMSSWSDYQRFAQELAELESKQRDLREQTLKEAVRLAAAGKDSPERAAARAKIRAAQAEIARRFGKLQQAMRKSADKSAESAGDKGPSSSAQALQDALSESRDRATRGKLDEAERQLRIGQLGNSARQQKSGADDMREMLDTLRDRASSDPGKLAKQLRKAQEKLEALQKELDKLQNQPDQGDQKQPRKKLAEKTRRMARRLNRLSAQQAGQSSQQGAQQMQQAAQQPQQGRQSLGKAQQSLERAKQQLAERIQQLKNIQDMKVLDRLAAKMDGFIARQSIILKSTVQSDEKVLSGEPPKEVKQSVQRLAGDQAALKAEVDIARRNVAEREVFDLALRGAVEQMEAARRRLEEIDPGRQTQQREYEALQRMKHVADALKITPPASEQQNQQNGGGQGGKQGQQQQRPPSPIDVAELKMLRLMQLGVNARTRDLEADAAEQRIDQRDAKQESERLSKEQSRLGELVRELIQRLTNPPVRPGALPDDAT